MVGISKGDNKLRRHKLGPKPTWIHTGVEVDYHEIIGGPITKPKMIVNQGPVEMCGTWVVWLQGNSGCVAVSACTAHVGE